MLKCKWRKVIMIGGTNIGTTRGNYSEGPLSIHTEHVHCNLYSVSIQNIQWRCNLYCYHWKFQSLKMFWVAWLVQGAATYLGTCLVYFYHKMLKLAKFMGKFRSCWHARSWRVSYCSRYYWLPVLTLVVHDEACRLCFLNQVNISKSCIPTMPWLLSVGNAALVHCVNGT